MNEQRIIERRPMGTAKVVDGKIVLESGMQSDVSYSDGKIAVKRTRRPVKPDIATSREQLKTIDEIMERNKPRKGGYMHRLLQESRAGHKRIVDRADYKTALLRAARQRDDLTRQGHADMAGELQKGLQVNDIDLTRDERRTIRRAVLWNLQQSK